MASPSIRLCKAGSLPKSLVGLEAEDTHLTSRRGHVQPIGQALLMNELKVDFTLILGLCVARYPGQKYLESPMSVLVVNDR